MWTDSTMGRLLSTLEGYGDVPEFEVTKIEKTGDKTWRIECRDNREAKDASKRKEVAEVQDAGN